MAKKIKTIEAGPLRKVILYTAPEPHDGPRARAQKSRVTSKTQKAANDKTSRGRLELVMAANFTTQDLFLTLTFRDGCLPKTRAEARKLFRKFMRALRSYRKAHGQELKYVYTIEDKHGEGRVHIHMVINSTGKDLEIIRSLWVYGDQIEAEYVSTRGYETLAGYITKERQTERPVGAQLWSGSKNLKKPIVKTRYVPNDTTLEPPLNAHILEKYEERLEFGHYCYYKYYLFPCKSEGSKGRAADREVRYTGL